MSGAKCEDSIHGRVFANHGIFPLATKSACQKKKKHKSICLTDMSLVTDAHIEEFRTFGVVVIEGVLSPEEVEHYRECFHREIALHNYDYHAIMVEGNCKGVEMNTVKKLRHTFYPKWKMELQADPRIHDAYATMLRACADGFGLSEEHLTRFYPFIDRMGMRFPDHIYASGGLGLHVDKVGIKYRPIQGFVALTDQLQAAHGGLQVVKQFHQHSMDNETTYRLIQTDHARLMSRIESIHVKAGSLVLWDYRLPHKTNDFFSSDDTREVLYMSYLPNTPINAEYHQAQWKAYRTRMVPPDFCSKPTKINYVYDMNLSEHAMRVYSA